jgi:hypothetical protein
MTKWLRILRGALAAATLLFLSLVPARAQQIQLDVVTIAVIENGSGISATLSAESGRALADFSRGIAGTSVEIRSAGEILAVVMLQTSIEGGVLQFPVREGNATEVARKISENARKLTIKVEGIKRFGPRPNPFDGGKKL